MQESSGVKKTVNVRHVEGLLLKIPPFNLGINCEVLKQWLLNLKKEILVKRFKIKSNVYTITNLNDDTSFGEFQMCNFVSVERMCVKIRILL